MTPFSYRQMPPPEYVCCRCGAANVRLFRPYQTTADAVTLTCQSCTESEAGKKLDSNYPHSIGWRVAAVPTEDGSTFWGFTSVPAAGVQWWEALPPRPGMPLATYPLPEVAEPKAPAGPASVLEDPRLKSCVYVVEATSYEKHALWLKHSSTAKEQRWGTGEYAWSGNGARGWWVEVGMLAGKPVTMELIFDTINGHTVLFYSATSRVVDYDMLEAWLRQHVPAYARHNTNASNFNHCLLHLRGL